MKYITVFLLVLLFAPASVLAWEGFDLQIKEGIYIEDGTPIYKGTVITIHDYSDGLEHNVEVTSVSCHEDNADLKVYDHLENGYRSFAVHEDGLSLCLTEQQESHYR